jgi:aromatic-L-amino-acid decarboxylase
MGSSGDDAGKRLEPDRATQERWLEVLGRFGLDHMASLEGIPAFGTIGSEGLAIAEEVSEPIPEEPLEGGMERIVEILDRASKAALVAPGPGYLAYIPGGGLYPSALADLVAGCMNRFTGLAAASPGLVRLEIDVLRWLARAFGYSDSAGGLFTSGGSLANFSAIVAARHEHIGEEGDLRRATVYTSTQAHLSVAKSVGIAGIPRANLRSVPVDERFRMDPEALHARIQADRGAGMTPFMVVSSAGTTNTGAVDPLPAINEICERESLWHHVDGAYGGAFVLCEEGRRILAGMEHADSITFDPHKGLFLPYGTGCLLVREGDKLRRAHHTEADYLQDLDDEGLPSATNLGPELTRSFRGLRLWLPLMLCGAAAFRAALSEKIALARRFHAGLLDLVDRGAPLEIVDTPQLSTVPFRLQRERGETLEAWNRRTSQVHAAINDRGRVYVSSTLLPVEDGAAFTSRICVLSFRTHAERIEACLEDLAHALQNSC